MDGMGGVRSDAKPRSELARPVEAQAVSQSFTEQAVDYMCLQS